jgi:hypothetical protein
MSQLSLSVAPLETVTATISKLHTKQQEHARQTIEAALEIGRLLSETRPTLKHGEWLKWTEQLPFSDRTARNYIRVYENRDRLKLETVSNLKEAYQLLTEPKAAPKRLAAPPTEDIEEGRFIPAPEHGISFQWQHHDNTSRELWIMPSDHESYYWVTEVTCFENETATVEGNRRPFKIDAELMKVLANQAGLPATAARVEFEAEPMSYNRWLYDDEAKAKEANLRHLLGR